MRRIEIAATAAVLCVLVIACSSCGPHMTVQPSIKPYERRMPDMPAGTVPTTGRPAALAHKEAAAASNPVPPTPENVRLGRIYYGYYCRMCHGVNGDGNGPVGESYVPKPADLSSPSVVSLTDGQLYSRMLTGTGHDPVLIQTVPPEERWQLVAYVRQAFAKPAKAPAPSPSAPPATP